jgi:hypothetical protein
LDPKWFGSGDEVSSVENFIPKRMPMLDGDPYGEGVLVPRRKRAYRQGDLDGLCGAYSVVNAVRYLFQLNLEQTREVFRALVRTLVQARPRSHDRLIDGIGFRHLKQLVTAADKSCRRCHGSAFEARPLRLGPGNRTLPGLWAALEQEVGPACVAIIGITGRTDHWCVVYQVTPKTLRLLDSAGRTRINRSRCTLRNSQIRYCLAVSEILLLGR